MRVKNWLNSLWNTVTKRVKNWLPSLWNAVKSVFYAVLISVSAAVILKYLGVFVPALAV